MSVTTPTRVKICGITSVADAEMVASKGADAIGLVFYEPSPRYVDIQAAAQIAKAVGPFVSVVGYSGASAILLDAYRKGIPGGTGESFDWARVPQNLNKPIVLAGGLKPSNAKQAAEQVRPDGLDVSGGVELTPGKKDPKAVTEFIANTR